MFYEYFEISIRFDFTCYNNAIILIFSDPKEWDTTHVLRWVEWNLRQCNTNEAELWRIREQLRLQSIKGYHLTKWTGYEYDRLFNYSSEYLQTEIRNWMQSKTYSSIIKVCQCVSYVEPILCKKRD